MKQSLKFLNEQDFQSFFGQLCSAEIPSFQAVEGAGGDKGFDGINGTTAYQVYFPEDKNRTDAKFITKIDADIEKVIKSKKELRLEIAEWIFVVPEDLRISVIAHLLQISKRTGINCIYWGATKLTELVTKYPYIRNSFPGIFLPDVKEDLIEVKAGINSLSRPRSNLNVEIITDREFRERDQEIGNEYRRQAQGVIQRFGTSSSAHIVASEAYREEANKKKRELRSKKEASDRAYELERQDIEDQFVEIIEKIQESFAIRGLGGSGLEGGHIGKAQVKKNRALEKLKLKYGKDE